MIFKVTINYKIDRPPFVAELRSPLERLRYVAALREIDPNLEFVFEEYPDPEDEGIEDPWYQGIAENDDCE